MMAAPDATLHTPHLSSDVSIMISYSRTDAAFAQKLCDDLKTPGFPTWMDTSDIPGGAEWKKEIQAGIDSAQVVLVVMSPAAMKSKWVRKEYRYALRRKKVVVPLDYLPCDIPAALARYQSVAMRPSFVADRDAYYAQQFRELTVAIARYATAVPIPVQTRQRGGRALTVALSLMGALSAALAAMTGYAGGALLPQAIQAYTARVFTGAFTVLLLSMLALVVLLARRPDGGVRLYLADRGRFLTKLQTRYTNRLKPPFERALLLTLGLTEDTQAVAQPTLASQEGPAAEPHLLPANTSITTAFEGAEGQLLILGAPGAGKSWLLYQLAQDLVRGARANGAIPVPVVFNLTSWAQDRKPLEGWMADQLVEMWQVPQTIARVWVEHRQFFPLLDGLDEVRTDARDACVAAINRYQHAHGLEPLAVCCRKVDYDALHARLNLHTAIVAQPLSQQQIDRYLEAGGAPLAELRTLASDDAEVSDLLSTPLMLSIVALAYYGEEAGAIPPLARDKSDKDNKSAWARTVFHDYVQRMLARRGVLERQKRHVDYSHLEVTRYLAWLAVQMRPRGQTDMFYLEWLQPDWLPWRYQRGEWASKLNIPAFLLGGPAGASLAGLLAGLVGQSLFGNQLAWGCGIAGGLIGGALGGMLILFTLEPFDDDGKTDETIVFAAKVYWRLNLKRSGEGLMRGFLGSGAVGTTVGVATGAIVGVVYTVIHLLYQLPAGIGGFIAFLVGLLFAFVWGLIVGGAAGGLLGAGFGMFTGLFVGPIYGLLAGMNQEVMDERDLTVPNEGPVRSLRLGVGVGLICGLLAGLFGEAVGRFFFGLQSGILLGLSLGFGFAVYMGLKFGASAYVRHRLLLRMLKQSYSIPPHYAAFLDFAADHVLLQRVGGGYRFIHALLLDYFADQWPALSATEPPNQ